ncbi:MAG: hypothetical protein QOH93_1997 [Chloroflexia bacterium]|nr:hypothetical protein [Chloroflexia bacterium]
MADIPAQGDQDSFVHVVYDNSTGRILGTYRHYNLDENRYEEHDTEEVLALFRGDERVLRQVTDNEAENLALLSSKLPKNAVLHNMQVSAKRQHLVSRPQLRLRADRDSLEGDGQDSLTIQIDVLDGKGKVMGDYKGEVHISTSRGKLSARRGQVALEGGRGSTNLVSVRETVDKVYVKVEDPTGMAQSDILVLAFE